MGPDMALKDLDNRLGKAIAEFWQTRRRQGKSQGRGTGRKDYGARRQVTGGAQLDGFTDLITELLTEIGLPAVSVVKKHSAVLPGYYRPTKQWDLVVVNSGSLVATIEFKSQVGSFGNNFNNRVEDALGSATDARRAYQAGVFAPSRAPWLGYLMLLEDHLESTRTAFVNEPHFKVLPEFANTSYAQRYELFCERLVREQLYDATCFLMSDQDRGLKGEYLEPSAELSFENFVRSLLGHAISYVM